LFFTLAGVHCAKHGLAGMVKVTVAVVKVRATLTATETKLLPWLVGAPGITAIIYQSLAR